MSVTVRETKLDIGMGGGRHKTFINQNIG